MQPSDATGDDTDWEIDQLLSQVPDPANICQQISYISGSPEPPTPASTWSLEPSPSSQFVKPFSDEEVQNLRKHTIFENTQKFTSFAVNVVECTQEENELE